MKDLETLRTEIDEIDRELVRLFEARMNVVLNVAAYKLENGLPILNAGREQQVLDKCCALLENKGYSGALCHTQLSDTYYYIHLVPGLLEEMSGFAFSSAEEFLPEVGTDE